MANDFVLPRLCDLGILHELCPTLNKLFIVDEDIENVLKVHPTWSQYLLDAGLRVPILNQYLSSLKHGNQDVYKKCRDEGRRRIRSIRQKLGIGTLITRICIDETFLHTVEPEIEFEIMIALLNGQHKFTKENIPELLVDGKLFSKEAILWAVSGCNKHNHKDLLDEMCNSLSEQTDIHHRYDPLYTNMVRHVAMCDYPEMFIALLNFLGDKRSQVTFELWLGVSDMPEIVCEAIFDENSYSDAPIQNFFSHLENFCSQALLFGRINALKWCYRMYPAMVTKKLTWYYVMHSEKLEVIQWYFQIRAELQLISNMFIDKPTWMAVDIQTDNNGRIQSIMPIDTFDYLVHPDRNLIIPTSRFLLAHPEISLNRALTFASFPTTIYDNVSLMFEHFEAVFWSFDRLKLSYFLTLTNQSGLPNQKNNILLREKLAVLGSYGANIPQFAKKWDVEPWMGFVFEKLGITPVLFQYHKISRAWSRLMPSNSDINMNWIVHKLARPFSHKYNTAKVFRFIRKFINNEQGGFLVSPLHYSKYMMRLFHKTVAFYNE